MEENTKQLIFDIVGYVFTFVVLCIVLYIQYVEEQRRKERDAKITTLQLAIKELFVNKAETRVIRQHEFELRQLQDQKQNSLQKRQLNALHRAERSRKRSRANRKRNA